MEDTQYIERITRLEEKVDQLTTKVDKIYELMEDYNSHQYECEKKFVRKDDPSYFNENMKRYENERIDKGNRLMTYFTNIYKLSMIAVGAILIVKQFIR
jgi:uncharacterized protein (UPF0335 family)